MRRYRFVHSQMPGGAFGEFSAADDEMALRDVTSGLYGARLVTLTDVTEMHVRGGTCRAVRIPADNPWEARR